MLVRSHKGSKVQLMEKICPMVITANANSDLRYAPSYEMSEAARLLHVSPTTIRNWFAGTNNGKPVLDLVVAPDKRYLSFMGLVEAHILSAMRTRHGVSLQRIRSAVEFLKIRFNSDHPLLQFEFVTDGIDLFIDDRQSITNVSQFGQTAIREVMSLYLERIERDSEGLPSRLFPFTQTNILSDERIIVIDPTIGFGRPTIGRSGIFTSAVSERFKSGESLISLAEDFGRPILEIEAAIRSEFELPTAA
jgi:uncharacterized protein (DUF433 family)